ncbi:MAG: ABC transporter permease [Myxococcales bacterium]|nr:ABC transporter permease [Myxococcales bacterium]
MAANEPLSSRAEDLAPPPKEPGFVHQLGAFAIEAFGQARDLYSVFVRTLYYSVYGRREKGMFAQQVFEQGNQSVFFLTVFMGFFGMILVFQAGVQALRVVPDLTLLGATFLQLLVRDLAASIGALMLATRVGAGIAAEIGSMVVTEQVDALRMCAADPIEYLVVPRFKAGIVATTAVIIWSAGVAFVSGMLTAWVYFGVNPRTFANLGMVGHGDLIVGLTKCLAYGAAIPIVSAQSGLSTFGGSEGVGSATTRAVVNSSLAVIILNFFISAAGLILFPGATQ